MSARWLLAIALAAGCHRGPKLPDGDIAASLTVKAIGSHAFDPASLRGKPSLVLFVSPTCKYCLATIPRAAAAAKGEDANAVLVFVVGREQNATGVVTSTHWTGPALVDEDGELKRRYAVSAVPMTLVLGADGHAHDVLEGEQDETDLRSALVAAK